MALKPRENRIPIMMSEGEVAAIDAWAEENGIATRSGAVRRLCHIALAVDKDFSMFFARVMVATDLLQEASRLAETNTDLGLTDRTAGIDILARLGLAREQVNLVSLDALDILGQFDTLSSGAIDLDAAIAAAKAERAEIAEMRARYKGVLPTSDSALGQQLIRRDMAATLIFDATAETPTTEGDLLRYLRELPRSELRQAADLLQTGSIGKAVVALGFKEPVAWGDIVQSVRVIAGTLETALSEGEQE